VRRVRHLLNVLDRHPERRDQVGTLLRLTVEELDATGLLADFGFAPRNAFLAELSERLRLKLLPATPDTADLGELFPLLFTDGSDALWLEALDARTLARLADLLAPSADANARRRNATVLDAMALLASQVRAAAAGAMLRPRLAGDPRRERPFAQLTGCVERLAASADDAALRRQESLYLRALLQRCRESTEGIGEHLETWGISVDVVFQTEQVRDRLARLEALLDLLMAEDAAHETRRLVAMLVRAGQARRGIRPLFAQHYSLLARKVAERHAETGSHYITRDRAEWLAMLRAALVGGTVIACTTFMKFLLLALGLSALFSGVAAGLNYAVSFVAVHLLGGTVATKQPAMTAPALAERLDHVGDDAGLDAFVDEVARLLRSQFAGIAGNLLAVVPVVLLMQGLAWLVFGVPLVGEKTAAYSLSSTSLWGPTALYAAFTGVILFAGSLLAGWVENWFVWHRLDSAIAWNPRIVAVLGAPRAQRWARWWRTNISSMAANVGLGLMLGLVPVLAHFIGLPLDVRHVTLSTGQIAAALGTLGPAALTLPAFWWAVAAIPVIGALNLGVSFLLAFRLAIRARGIQVQDRARVRRALWRRLRTDPFSFFRPPREVTPTP
jgi:site-specific recombinase